MYCDSAFCFRKAVKYPDNAKEVLKAYVERLWRPDARPLDLISADEEIEGAVVPICISREQIIETTIEEMINAVERDFESFDSRLPIDVSFCLEGKFIFI